jgi:AraC-like DNA-binding protein
MARTATSRSPDGASAEPSFRDQCLRFAGTSQVLAIAIAERSRTPREAAEMLAGALPAAHSPAEFLFLRSLLVTFATRAFHPIWANRLSRIEPLLRLEPGSAALGRTFIDCMTAIDASPARRGGSIQKTRAGRAMALISARYWEPTLTMEAVASAVGVSAQYLAKLLRRQYACGFRAAVRKARINAARAQLQSSFSSIKEIAARSGYSSSSQFVRDFRHEYHLTPGDYRRNFWAEHDTTETI